MALKGDLRDFSTTQLFNLINLARKTGTLEISASQGRARLCFKEGKLIYATLDGQDESLTSVLHKAGKITEEQARAIEATARVKSDKEVGLLLAGYVTQADVVRIMRAHILNNTYPLFTWSEGVFHFESNLLPFEERITVPIDLESIIMEGSRRLEEWERLQEELPSLDVTLKFAERPNVQLRNINLSVEEWRVVSFINPRNTVRQVAQYNNMSEFQIRKIVYGLLQAGLVELIRPERMVVSAPPGVPAPPEVPTPPGVPTQAPVSTRPPAVKRNVILRLIDRIRKL